MKALLMHRKRDFDLAQEPARNEAALMQDLELDTLLSAMAGEDEFLLDVAHKALLCGLQNDMDTIIYRQAALKDSLKNPEVVRSLYDLAVEAIVTKQNQRLGIFSHNPSAILHGAINLVEMFTGILEKVRNVAKEHAEEFESEAFRNLFAMLEEELSDE